jgi:hypothetical protein
VLLLLVLLLMQPHLKTTKTRGAHGYSQRDERAVLDRLLRLEQCY